MGVTALGYLRLNSPQRAQWETFAGDLLGVPVDRDEASSRLRLDDRGYRVWIADAETESVESIGWELPSTAALTEQVALLVAAGFTVEQADPETAKGRQVSDLYQVADPSGYTLDLFAGQLELTSPAVSSTGARFVTNDLGFGHVVLGTADLDATVAFYVDLLGFRVSDTLMLGRSRTVFLHCNARHHSLALVEARASFLHHIMFEVEDIDSVGRGFDAIRAAKVPVTMDLGRHSNDKMFSFYCRTPSGFEVEYGHGGLLIDDATWSVTEWSRPSLWGHHHQKP